MPPTYYRGCWHVVSRGFLVRYRLFSSLLIELYVPRYFFTHAASLDQGCPHCPIFPTAASRRSKGRISVPLWPFTLSGRLPIIALVGRYPANQLIGRKALPQHLFSLPGTCVPAIISGFISRFRLLSLSAGQVLYALLTRPPWLGCASTALPKTCMC